MLTNANAKTRHNVLGKRHEKTRETGSSATKKILKYWLLGLRRRTRQAAKNYKILTLQNYQMSYNESYKNHILLCPWLGQI